MFWEQEGIQYGGWDGLERRQRPNLGGLEGRVPGRWVLCNDLSWQISTET